jgi:hypothetical protein
MHALCRRQSLCRSICSSDTSLEVLKPHSKDVTAIEFSADGTLLATGSTDGTVFLLHAESVHGDLGAIPHFKYDRGACEPVHRFSVTPLHFGQAFCFDHAQQWCGCVYSSRRFCTCGFCSPIGFVKVPGVVTSLAWHPTERQVLVTTADGAVLLLPVPHTFPSTSTSYDLELPFAQYKVMLQPPPRLVLQSPSKQGSGVSSASDGSGDGESKEGGVDGDDAGGASVVQEYIIEEPRETGAALAAGFHPSQVQPSSCSLFCAFPSQAPCSHRTERARVHVAAAQNGDGHRLLLTVGGEGFNAIHDVVLPRVDAAPINSKVSAPNGCPSRTAGSLLRILRVAVCSMTHCPLTALPRLHRLS